MPSPIASLTSLFHRSSSTSSSSETAEKKAQSKLYKSLAHPSKNPPSLNIKGLPLKNTQVVTLSPTGEIEAIHASESSATATLNPHRTPPSFVVAGDLELFGIGLPAKLYKFIGKEKSSGVQEQVHLNKDVLLKDLLNGLEKHPYGAAKLGAAKFTYRLADTDTKEPAGVYFEATVSLEDGPLVHIGKSMDNIFGIQQSQLQLSGYVSKERNWSKPLSPRNFTLRAVMRGIRSQKDPVVTFTEVGVEITAERGSEMIRGHGKYKLHVNFFGKLALKVPGSIAALDLKYTVHEDVPGVWTMRVKKDGAEWIDVVGFKGLKLSNLQLVANFPIGKKIDGFSFDIHSTMNFGKETLLLEGRYKAGQFFVESKVPHCTLDDIRQLYSSMTDRELEPFNHEVSLDNIILHIDKTGLNFSGAVTIDTHHSVNASISIKRDGISITGSVVDIKLGEVTIEKAELDVFIGRKVKNATSRETGLSIEGKVSFLHLEIDVTLETVFSKEEGIQWTVFGEIGGTDMKLNHLAPEVKDTWLDLQLQQVAFIVSNMDSPECDDNIFNYPIQKGVQFCATIDQIEPVNHVTRKKVTGLVLRAAYSSSQGFSFGVILPTPVGISLGKHITSGPVSIEITASKKPQIIFSAEVNVHPPRQTQPLAFTFGLKASLEEAEGFGQMKNYWINPFGINERVKIGPDMCLEIGIIYAVIASTGTPSKVGVSGGMAIGDTEAQCAVVISENPLDELIKASLSELSATDLVKFASEVCGDEFVLPPEDLFAFRDVLIYISTGVSCGKTYYPAGVSFKGEIELLGKQAAIEATIGSTTKISAIFDELIMGPLTISGSKEGTKPSTVIELGLAKQHMMVDGSIKLLTTNASIHGVLDILPKPDVALSMELDFAKSLEMSLDARVIGLENFSNLHEADFRLHAVLEQDILNYLVTQLKTHLMAVLRFLRNGIEAAHEFIECSVKAVEDAVSVAVSAVEEAKHQFDQKQASVFGALAMIRDEFENGVQALEQQVGSAKKDLDNDVTDAHHQLEQARIEHAAAVTSAVYQLRKSQKELGKQVRGHLKEVRAVKEERKMACGHVYAELQKAKDAVIAAQDYYDQCCKQYVAACQELEDAPFFRKFDISLKVERTKVLKDAAQSDLFAAQNALEDCQNCSHSSGYDVLKQNKAEKKLKLITARKAEKETLESIQKDLEARKAAGEAVLQDKEKRLHDLANETTSPVLTKIKESQKALEGFKSEKAPLLEQKKKEAAEIHDSEESRKVKEAKTTLRKAAAAKPETAIAKDVLTELEKVKKDKPSTEEDEKHASTLEKLLDAADNALRIELIELDGSAKELVEHGKPLKARVKGVLGGKPFDIMLDYSLGNVAEFVKALWRLIWEAIKDLAEGVEDFFHGDLSGAFSQVKEGVSEVKEITKDVKPIIDETKEVTKVVRAVEKSEQSPAKKTAKFNKVEDTKVESTTSPVAEKKPGVTSSIRRKLSKKGRKSSSENRKSMDVQPLLAVDESALASEHSTEHKRRSWYAGMNMDWKAFWATGGHE